MVLLRGEIDGATKGVKDAFILMLTTECAKLLVEPFGTAAAQCGDAADT